MYEWKKSKELLGLPVTCYINHAVLASVAHKHHGAQMRTGYAGNFTSLFDRDDDLCNILIETVLSNFLKMDYDEKFYPNILSMFDKVNVPTRFYDPNLSRATSTVFKDAEIPDEPNFALADMRAITEPDASRFNEENADVEVEAESEEDDE